MLSLSYLLQRLLDEDNNHLLRSECVTTETSSTESLGGRPEVRLEDMISGDRM